VGLGDAGVEADLDILFDDIDLFAASPTYIPINRWPSCPAYRKGHNPLHDRYTPIPPIKYIDIFNYFAKLSIKIDS